MEPAGQGAAHGRVQPSGLARRLPAGLGAAAADAPQTLRADIMLGAAWGESMAGDPARAASLLDEVASLVTDPDDTIAAEMALAEITSLIRQGRFSDCESVAERGGAAARRAARLDLTYGIWIQTACALSAAGNLTGALRAADAAVAATRGMTVIELPCLGARVRPVPARPPCGGAVGGRRAAGQGRTDGLTGGRGPGPPRRGADLAGGRPLRRVGAAARRRAGRRSGGGQAARLAHAEALARSGRPDEAAEEVRQAALEPVRNSDQPWALVPRMTRVQGLIALARGDRAAARRRLSEAAAGWQRHLEPNVGAELLANFVDLGRAPIVGLVEPEWELRRLTAELAGLDELTEVP